MSRDFNGTTSLIHLGSPTLLNDMEPMTWATWIYPETTGESNLGRILAKQSGAGNFTVWNLSATDTGMTLIVDYLLTDLQVSSTTNSLTLNRWQHVAVTWTGEAEYTGVRFYRDGNLLAYSTTQNGLGLRQSDATQPLFIGNRAAADRTFDGQMAHVHVFRRVLDVNEIKEIMQHPGMLASGVVASAVTAGLVGYWSLGGMSPNEPDLSGNGHTGTLTTTPFSARNPPVNEAFGPTLPSGVSY